VAFLLDNTTQPYIVIVMSMLPHKHLEQYPANTLDGSTRRILREMLVKMLADHQTVVDSITDPKGRAEFDTIFAEDVAAWQEAIVKLDEVENGPTLDIIEIEVEPDTWVALDPEQHRSKTVFDAERFCRMSYLVIKHPARIRSAA
jgi:hypothetical protein